MRRLSVFTLLFAALWLATGDEVAAFGHRCGGCGGGHCGGGRCHHRCRHSCGGCYGCGSVCGTCNVGCPGGVCVAGVSTHATIIVSLPADATLTVDGAPTTSTSSVRTFVTPVLATGQTYAYTLQARMSNGQVVTQQVNFRAGEQTTVNFEAPVTVAQP